jgi:hypothetical protein
LAASSLASVRLAPPTAIFCAGGQRHQAGVAARVAAGRRVDRVVHLAVQRRHRERGVAVGGIGQQANLVQLVDQFGPALVAQVEPATRVRHFDELGVRVARGDVVGLGLAQALGGLRLADDAGFDLAPRAQAGLLLLVQDAEVVPVLLHHVLGDLEAHGMLLKLNSCSPCRVSSGCWA